MATTKQKISISVTDATLEKIELLVETGKFRNRSHCFEYALQKVMDNE